MSEVTTKTGSHKSYAVFVKMLVSALQHTSDSVCVDLLTYSDLEVLKAKRLRRAGQSVPVPAAGGAANNKRYLILTYQGEFDKVHYPLPLAFEEYPDPSTLKATIVSLRGALRLAIDRLAARSVRAEYVQLCIHVSTGAGVCACAVAHLMCTVQAVLNNIKCMSNLSDCTLCCI